MHFLWPQFLWLLLAVPLLVALYAWLMRRKKKNGYPDYRVDAARLQD